MEGTGGMKVEPDQLLKDENRDDRYICELCGGLYQNVEKRTGCWCELEEIGDNCEICGAELLVVPGLPGTVNCPAGCWKCGECGESFGRYEFCAECVLKRQGGRLY